jgi:hypothetical protein
MNGSLIVRMKEKKADEEANTMTSSRIDYGRDHGHDCGKSFRADDTKCLRAIWGHLSGYITVIPCFFLGKETDIPSTGWGELRALIYAMSVFYSFYNPNRIRVLPSKLAASHPELLGDNILVLGGPVANDLAKILIEEKEKWKLDMPFYFDGYKLVSGENKSLTTTYAMESDPLTMMVDYGCIIRRRIELWGRDRNLWMFMGSHTYGTYSAVLACLSGQFCNALIKSDQADNYNVIVKAENLQAIMSGVGDVLIYTQEFGKLPAVGPIRNPADIDAAIKELIHNLLSVQAARKRLAYGLLAIAVTVLTAPYVIRFLLF